MSSFHESYPYGAGRGLFAPAPSERIDAVALAAGDARAHPVPAGFSYVVFSFTDNIYARFGGANVVAQVPSASSTDGMASELNPAARRIPPGTTHIGLAASNACVGSLAFYA